MPQKHLNSTFVCIAFLMRTRFDNNNEYMKQVCVSVFVCGTVASSIRGVEKNAERLESDEKHKLFNLHLSEMK